MIKVLGKRRTAEPAETVLLSEMAGGRGIVDKESLELELLSPSCFIRSPYSGESREKATGKLLDEGNISCHNYIP